MYLFSVLSSIDMIADEPVVQLNALTKEFSEGDQKRIVLNQLNNHFERGQFTVILGSSGSGKSTLLNLIGGIEKPTSGYVSITGANITALNDTKRTLFRRDNIGFVFQFFNLIPTLTVLENITLPSELAGKSRKDIDPLARQLLGRVDLANRADSFPDKLSGGEQQRIAICRSLAHDPMLILADEPTGNLDEKTGGLVMSLLLELTRDAGKTLLMATHSLELVTLADHALQIQNGKLVRYDQS